MNVVPTKVYEAAATGLAVVTADTPPQRRVLGDAAVYVAPGDPVALAAALEAFADHPARVAQLAADARALADRHFRPGAVVQPLLDQLPVVRRGRFPAPALSLNAWHRWDVVGPLLESLEPASVLEVGPGRGAAAARLAARARYVGVEPDPTSAAAACAALTAAGVRDAIVVDDLARVDGRDTFDLVCAFEVLEHVPDDSGSLASWSEYLRPGGHVLVSVPAHRHRYGPWDERVGHLRRYDRGDLAKLFADAGVSLERVWAVGWPMAYALEAARDVVARVRPARGSSAERSAASGRLLQPPPFLGPAWRAASWPGRLLQRRTFDTDAGVGWVAFGRRL
jgi:SAM-dependent methyltransferase